MQTLVLLDQGRVVAQGTPSELRGGSVDRLRLELVAVDQAAARHLAGEFTGAEPAVVSGRRVAVPIEPKAAATILAWAQQEREAGRVDEFAVTPVSLEDVYIRLVGAEHGGTEEGDHAALAA